MIVKHENKTVFVEAQRLGNSITNPQIAPGPALKRQLWEEQGRDKLAGSAFVIAWIHKYWSPKQNRTNIKKKKKPKQPNHHTHAH